MRSGRLVRLLSLPAALLAASDAWPQIPFDLDTTFRTGINTWYVSSILPLDDGKVIVSGQLKFPGDLDFYTLARLNADGNEDASFNTSALGGGFLRSWISAFYVNTPHTVRRILPDGTQDPSFIEMNSGPYFSSLQGGDYHVYPDGRILMSGVHGLSDTARGFVGLHCLVWFSNTGYLDTTKTHRICAGSLDFFRELPNGQFVGSLGNPPNTASWEGQPTGSNVIRFNADGEWDPSFQANVWWGTAYCLLPMPDGRIYAGGSFRVSTLPNDTLHLVRFMPDGSLDPTFYSTAKYRAPSMNNMQLDGGLVRSIQPLADGKLIIGGQFDNVDGSPRGCIAVVDSTGMLLDTYFTGAGAGNFTYQGVTAGSALSVPAPDGSWYLYGAYHGYDDGTTNDTSQRMVSRLHGPTNTILSPETRSFALTLHHDSRLQSLHIQVSDPQPPFSITIHDALGKLLHASAPRASPFTVATSSFLTNMCILRVIDSGGRASCAKFILP